MSFFAVLLALLLEQVKPLASRQRRPRFARRVGSAPSRATSTPARTATPGSARCITALVPALACAAVYVGLAHVHALLGLAFDVAVLYLTLGFRQFSHYFTDIRAALERGDEVEARRLLAEWRHLDASELPASEFLRHLIEHSLLAAHQATCSACSSGSCCCRRSAWGLPAPCCTAWPSSSAATGRIAAAAPASPSTSA